jgi:hypothetical protein
MLPMWQECPKVLDEPVKILGMEVEDFATVAVSPLFLSLVCDAMLSFALAAALGVGLYLSKRGRTQGALWHTLHALELLKLPGVLGPQEKGYSPW